MKIKAIVAIFIPWEFNQKYVHLGVSYPGVPNGWQKIVKKAIKDLEPIIWHRGKYLPRFVKRFIHYMANEITFIMFILNFGMILEIIILVV